MTHEKFHGFTEKINLSAAGVTLRAMIYVGPAEVSVEIA